MDNRTRQIWEDLEADRSAERPAELQEEGEVVMMMAMIQDAGAGMTGSRQEDHQEDQMDRAARMDRMEVSAQVDRAAQVDQEGREDQVDRVDQEALARRVDRMDLKPRVAKLAETMACAKSRFRCQSHSTDLPTSRTG
ncbi:hypothetical protein [Pyruvatibacter sp.]